MSTHAKFFEMGTHERTLLRVSPLTGITVAPDLTPAEYVSVVKVLHEHGLELPISQKQDWSEGCSETD